MTLRYIHQCTDQSIKHCYIEVVEAYSLNISKNKVLENLTVITLVGVDTV